MHQQQANRCAMMRHRDESKPVSKKPSNVNKMTE
eukprot:CAMPEP_0175149414 /NCGR_PEP_ID=MMETSP0087-20121206/17234_1 /TAXON_ID=136419 /ORGANISM="Unknown Unknown, Strain D1" /LENGTH=33 /DNA_ID= /DNA_START= /DNA_END= /DNA_ORIENTATION=